MLYRTLSLASCLVGSAVAAGIPRDSFDMHSCYPTHNWPGWSRIKHAFIFGDSYTSTSFNASGIQPASGNPLGNPPYPGWTSANGPNWVDFLTVKYNASPLLTYNLAVGGATVNSALVAPYLPTVKSLAEQIEDLFFPFYAGPGLWTPQEALFGIWIGINDIGNSPWTDTSVLYSKIFDVYDGLIEMLYNAGARNILFLSVPPVDRSPLTLERSPADQKNERTAILTFNALLAKMASGFKRAHPDANIFTVDTHKLFTKVLDKPSSFPQTALYKDTTKYCAAYQNGTPKQDTFDASCPFPVNEYFWLNSLHPTYPMHDVVAQQVAARLLAGPNVC